MRHNYQANYMEVAHKFLFYIGDVRNKSTLKTAMRGRGIMSSMQQPSSWSLVASSSQSGTRPCRRLPRGLLHRSLQGFRPMQPGDVLPTYADVFFA